MKQVDVIVVGGGHAGLCAAITAREQGASVCLLEIAPRDFRGGNTRHTRNLRPMHELASPPMEGAYDFAEYLDDLNRVTHGETSQALATLTIRESAQCVEWLSSRGVAFQPPLSGTLQLGRTNAFFLGGGKALINSLYRHAERLSIEIAYQAEDIKLNIEQGHFQCLTYHQSGREHTLQAGALVTAAGGFQANLEWLAEAFGPEAENFLVRGTPYNRGSILRQLLDAGVKPVGKPQQCHAVAIDARAPKFDGGIVTRVDCVPFGIVVNSNGERFHDEGEDFWPKRYANWGTLIARQQDQVSYAIIDNKATGLFMPTVFPPVTAATIESLAVRIGVPAASLVHTIENFNAAVVPGNFDHRHLDHCHTSGLSIPKSNWARRIDTPPYQAYPLKPGITFTFLGVAVNECAKVLMQDGNPSNNIYSAGEMMAGNILGRGYLAGIGMTIGNVFGRIAGHEAASHA